MLNVRWSAVAALVLMTSTGTACRKPASDGSKPQPGTAAQASSAPGQVSAAGQAPPPAPEPIKAVPEQLPDVLARVNGESIPRSEFDKLIMQMEAAAGQPVPKERRDEIYRGAIDQLVTYTLLAQEVKARGVKVDDKQVDDELKQMRAQFKTEPEFKKALASRGMTLERLRSDLQKKSGINAMMEAEVAGAPAVTDAEIREFYEKNPDKFQQPEAIKASHILIRAPKDADDAVKKAARTKVEALLKQAKAGSDFGTLARENSSDGSAQQGGDLGFFPKGQMVPAFEQAAYALKPGQISEVVETQFGYHIIKVRERRDASTVALAEVTDRVREFLTGQRKQEQAEAFIKVLKSKSKIEVLI
ncbi:MAG TPA: peptidylprolyl isomerase [Vicinamibacterales bacterium]|nr:peptidylprolyl isomerase [Vicinamibacterales bacterium]